MKQKSNPNGHFYQAGHYLKLANDVIRARLTLPHGVPKAIEQVLDTLLFRLLALPAGLDIRMQTKRSKTAIILVTVILCSAKAIKVAFGSLNLPDQFRLGLAEGANAISLAYIPDFLHFHFGPLFDLQPNDPNCLPIEFDCWIGCFPRKPARHQIPSVHSRMNAS